MHKNNKGLFLSLKGMSANFFSCMHDNSRGLTVHTTYIIRSRKLKKPK